MIGKASNGHETNEVNVIKTLLPLTAKRKELLLHPIINTFVMVKYNSYALIVFLFILLRLIFCLLMTGLTLGRSNVYCKNANLTDNVTTPTKPILTTTTNSTTTSEEPLDTPSIERSSMFWICFGILLILNTVLFLHHIFSIVINVRVCKQFRNGHMIMMQLVYTLLYVTSFAYLITMITDIAQLCQWTNIVSSLIVLSSWVALTMSFSQLLIGRFFSLGSYICMLREVIKKVICFFCLYLSLLLGFALALHLMMREEVETPFDSPWRIPKVVAMMVGELEFGDTFADKDRSIIALFFLFVVVVPIIINNLLIGLTVSDVAELISSANMDGLVFKLKRIATFDDNGVMNALDFVVQEICCLKNQNHLISEQDQPDFEVSPPLPIILQPQVAILPNHTKKNVLSPEPYVRVYEVEVCMARAVTMPSLTQVNRNEDDQRMVRDPWGYLGIGSYVPIEVVNRALDIVTNLKMGDEKAEEQ